MDPVDQIIVANSPPTAAHILVVDAPGLVEQARWRAERVSIWCDDVRDARAVPSELLLDQLDAEALAGVDLVWLRLPPALGELAQYAEVIAAYAAPQMRLIAGGREKHLNRSMNQTLAEYFTEVAASLGQAKSRALFASEPIGSTSITWPRHRTVSAADQEIDLWWHGGTFAAGRIDAGTQLLIEHLDRVAEADNYLDLGCGSGMLATLLARQHPDATVHAVDSSWAAVDATRRTAAGTGVQRHWASDLREFDRGDLDVIVCNPPFHRDKQKQSAPTIGLFAEAARTLSAGGEFWCVFNSHLPWRSRLSQTIGETQVIAQNRHYTLTRSLQS